MVGDGIRPPFTVTDSGASTSALGRRRRSSSPTPRRAVRRLRRGPGRRSCSPARRRSPRRTRPATTTRPATLYPPTRVHWERIEPVAESFGDLDPLLDVREADLAEGAAVDRLAPHREGPVAAGAEANGGDAYVPLTHGRARGRRRRPGRRHRRSSSTRSTRRTSRSPRSRSRNGAKELLDEVATGKVTGEEEIWSHTDLWDFQANVDGAKVAFEVLRGRCLGARTPSWSTTLDDAVRRAARRCSPTHGSLDDGFKPLRQARPRPRSRRSPPRSTRWPSRCRRLTTTVTGAG